MRILCIIDNLGSGGAQRQLVNLGVGLQKRGYDVTFFNYYPHDHFRHLLDAQGIPVLLHQKSSRFSVKPILALRRVIKERKIDAALAFLNTPSVYAELACLNLPIKLVVGERSAAHASDKRLNRTLRSYLHRLADVVTTNSHAHREWLSSNYPLLKPKLRTIWNGVDLNVFSPPKNTPQKSESIRLLGVGRITKAKNLPNLVQALRIAKEQGIKCTIHWAGRRDAETSYCHSVLNAVKNAGLEHNWHWLGERQDIPELMRNHDALILPSLWEGLPNVVCEALASGLPVLASRVADNDMLIQHGQTGFHFDPNSTEDIAQAIRCFSELTAQEHSVMRSNARAFAEQHLSQDKCTSEYESLLQQ